MSNKHSIARRERIRENGVAAVEFALVLPIFLLLVFGIIELGVALYDKHVVTQASREAVRAGIVLRNPILPDDKIIAIGKDRAKNLILFGTGDPSVTVTRGPDLSNGSVPMLSVTVSHQYSGLLLGPTLSAFNGPITISGKTSMDYE